MKKQVSLVLSGGGARGIAHIGVIEEIERQGFEIFSISGTSMGALVGGVYALGKMEEFKKWILSLDKMQMINLVDFTLSSQGLIKGDKVLNKMKEFIPDSNIEKLSIAYTAVATDIINKEEVAFKTGSIYEAIRASIAFPTVFTPVKTENGLLLDGGVINNIPINHALRKRHDMLIVVNVNADIPAPKPPIVIEEEKGKKSKYHKKIKDLYTQLQTKNPSSNNDNIGYFDLINKTIGLMTDKMALMSLEKYSPDILINVSKESCGIFDFYEGKGMVEEGREAAKESIDNYMKKR